MLVIVIQWLSRLPGSLTWLGHIEIVQRLLDIDAHLLFLGFTRALDMLLVTVCLVFKSFFTDPVNSFIYLCVDMCEHILNLLVESFHYDDTVLRTLRAVEGHFLVHSVISFLHKI